MTPSQFQPCSGALARVVVLAALAIPAAAQCEPQWQAGEPIVNPVGRVIATRVWDPDGMGSAPSVLVAGGNFSVGTMVSTAIATFDGTRWSPLGALPGATVTALTVWNGQLVAAVSAYPATPTVVMWNGSSWQSLGSIGSSAVEPIAAMTVFQGALVVAGGFQSIGGVAVNNIASWNGTTWSALGSGVSGDVRALALFSNVLYVGGSLNSAGGIPVGNLAIWNGSGWVATQRLNGPVRTLATRLGQSVVDSFLFAGGDFWIIGSGSGAITAHGVARYNASTNAWTAMGTTLNGISCRALFVRSIGAFGYEVVAGVADVDPVRRWDGTAWPRLGTGAGVGAGAYPAATSLAYFGSRYVLSMATSRTVIELEGSVWRPVSGPGFIGRVLATLEDGSDLIVGGYLPSISGVAMHGVARRSGNAWLALGTGVSGGGYDFVCALARLPNGDVVAGGEFASARGGVGDHIARWNGSAWSPLGSGMDGAVRALVAMPNGDVIAGGDFTTAGGVVATYIARWNGLVWAPLSGGMNGPVHALARLPNGDVVAGGEFTLAGSVIGVANRVARWNGSAWAPLGGGCDNRVRALAVMPNGDLMAGGMFLSAGGVPAPSVARWNGSAWAGTAIGQGMFDVSALSALPNGDLVAGGQPLLLRMTGNSVSPLPISGVSVDSVLTTRSGDLVVGGEFWSAGDQASANFARLVPPCAATAVAYGAGCSGSAGRLTFVATARPWIGGTYRATTTGISSNAVVVDLLGFASAATPLSALVPIAGPGCDLFVRLPAISQALVPVGGTATTGWLVPRSTALIGAQVFDQVLQLELANGVFTALHASNGLALTVGDL